MKERGILFSVPMVRALLDGSKTQTRRAWRDQPPAGVNVTYVPGQTKSPYGQPGDRLWVRETARAEELPDGLDGIRYQADNSFIPIVNDHSFAMKWLKLKTYGKRVQHDSQLTGPWIPSIHMTRWASRITLEITDVRVERLQDISEADAQAEGCALECMTVTGDDDGSVIYGPGGYMALWESINGPGSWGKNSWVWVVEFKRIQEAS